MTRGNVLSIRCPEFTTAYNDVTADDRVARGTWATPQPRLNCVPDRSGVLEPVQVPNGDISDRPDRQFAEFTLATEASGALPRRHLERPTSVSSVSPAIELREQHRLAGLKPHGRRVRGRGPVDADTDPAASVP